MNDRIDQVADMGRRGARSVQQAFSGATSYVSRDNILTILGIMFLFFVIGRVRSGQLDLTWFMSGNGLVFTMVILVGYLFIRFGSGDPVADFILAIFYATVVYATVYVLLNYAPGFLGGIDTTPAEEFFCGLTNPCN